MLSLEAQHQVVLKCSKCQDDKKNAVRLKTTDYKREKQSPEIKRGVHSITGSNKDCVGHLAGQNNTIIDAKDF